MKNKPTLVILAAGKIASKLPFFASLSECPALVPMGTKSSILHQLDFYRNKVAEVIILTNKIHVSELDQEILPEKIKNKSLKINIIGCNTKNVIKTLQFFCNQKSFQKNKEYLVNLSTTIPSRLIPSKSFGFANEKKVQQDWSGITLKNKKLKIYYRKNISGDRINAFIGIFRMNGENLKKNILKCKSDDLIEILCIESKTSKVKFTFQKWMDIGHSSNYFETKMQVISSRYFNSVRVDDQRGTIVKFSKDKEKILNEFLYINNLPRDLNIYFPRIISQKKDLLKKSYIEMEYYAYPTLSEISLFWDIKNGQWENCFSTLSKILKKFRANSYNFSRKSYENFYYNRLKKRVEKYLSTLKKYDYQIMKSDYLLVNGDLIRGYFLLLPKIKERLRSMYDKSHFCIMHGDLCFNNILYEPFSSTIRLIDARGSFNNQTSTIYGDQKYDYAKLSHSAVHFYDYILAGRYQIDLKKDEINYCFRSSENYEIIAKKWNKQIEKDGYSVNDINFIVGILFLSMTPLHSEDSLRQKLMFIHGLYILNKFL